MTSYRGKPIVIQAVQWNGVVSRESVLHMRRFTDAAIPAQPLMITWFDAYRDNNKDVAEVYDYLQDTWVNVNLGDWIIKGTQGEFYPCADKVFRAKYEEVPSG